MEDRHESLNRLREKGIDPSDMCLDIGWPFKPGDANLVEDSPSGRRVYANRYGDKWEYNPRTHRYVQTAFGW